MNSDFNVIHENFSGRMVSTYKKGVVQKTEVDFGEFDPDTDQFAPSKVTVHFPNDERYVWENKYLDAYVGQFGVSVSHDGRFVFAQTWENGIFCYDARTGEKVWRSKSRRGITGVFVNQTTVLVHQREYALQLLDIETGAVLKEKRPASAWDFFALDGEYIACQTTANSWEIIRASDLETMEVVPDKHFRKEWFDQNMIEDEDGEVHYIAFFADQQENDD